MGSIKGHGGSASSRATDLCLSGPGSNPGSTLSFFRLFTESDSILAERWAFSIRMNHSMQQSMSYSSLLNIVSINCNQCFKERDKIKIKIQKEAGKGPYLKIDGVNSDSN